MQLKFLMHAYKYLSTVNGDERGKEIRKARQVIIVAAKIASFAYIPREARETLGFIKSSKRRGRLVYI